MLELIFALHDAHNGHLQQSEHDQAKEHQEQGDLILERGTAGIVTVSDSSNDREDPVSREDV